LYNSNNIRIKQSTWATDPVILHHLDNVLETLDTASGQRISWHQPPSPRVRAT